MIGCDLRAEFGVQLQGIGERLVLQKREICVCE